MLSSLTIVGAAARDDQDYMQQNRVLQRHLLLHADRYVEQLHQSQARDEIKSYAPYHIFTYSGNLYARRGKAVDAELMYQHAIDGYLKVLGNNHEATINGFNDLGSLFANQKKFADAEPFFLKAVEASESLVFDGSKEATETKKQCSTVVLIAHANQVKNYVQMGRQKDALNMNHEALQAYERLNAHEDNAVFDIYHKLGTLYVIEGKAVEAEEMYQRAVIGKERTSGPDILSTLGIISHLAQLYTVQNKMEVEVLYKRALCGFIKMDERLKMGFDWTIDEKSKFSHGNLRNNEPSW